jgi:UDP-N-acetylmuramate dehydrogenase
MNMADIDNGLAAGLRGEERRREPMARHTSWRAGGVAERSYAPADLEDLVAFLRGLPSSEPVHMVGLGSNLLVRDGGLSGTVIFTHWALRGLRLAAPGRIHAEAGVASPKVARFAALHELARAEFLAGIPGTVGGALAMNAGCYGGETWEIVADVATVDRGGTLRKRTRDDYDIAYRHVRLKGGDHPSSAASEIASRDTDEVTSAGRRGTGGQIPDQVRGPSSAPRPAIPHPSEEWFVGATFALPSGSAADSRTKITELLKQRIATQPLGEPNAGSVFRNPKGNYAARLIEACGLKGRAIGGAEISRKHANFIVNLGDARAADIEALIELAERSVKEKFGVALEREVRIVGDK